MRSLFRALFVERPLTTAIVALIATFAAIGICESVKKNPPPAPEPAVWDDEPADSHTELQQMTCCHVWTIAESIGYCKKCKARLVDQQWDVTSLSITRPLTLADQFDYAHGGIRKITFEPWTQDPTFLVKNKSAEIAPGSDGTVIRFLAVSLRDATVVQCEARLVETPCGHRWIDGRPINVFKPGEVPDKES